MADHIKQRILMILKKNAPKPVGQKDLYIKARIKRSEAQVFKRVLADMLRAGEIVQHDYNISLVSGRGYERGVITKLADTFGFARLDKDQREVFIPGKYLMGAMPGDRVTLKVSPSDRDLDDARVVSVVEQSNQSISGVAYKERGAWLLSADKSIRSPIRLDVRTVRDVKEGDKIVAKISRRGERHDDHRASIISAYGTSQSAKNCVAAILEVNEVSAQFPAEVAEQARAIAEKGIHPKELEAREDLRGELIFTIDSAYSKDMDDAVSLTKGADGYHLSVHIADVSYYVTPGSFLDQEAYKRGTSIYFADKVIPMLPPELSNDLCSLNPNTDRLAFSVFIHLSFEGKMINYYFKKTVINSHVKGVYSEINDLLEGKAEAEIEQKYSQLKDMIFLMKELSDILKKNRFNRGALDLESTESRIALNQDDRAVEIVPRETGISEGIIEEFMLTANEAAAQFGLKRSLPFIFRVHETPSPQKLEFLKEVVEAVGISGEGIEGGVSQARLSKVLRDAKNTPYHHIVNNTLLRSMAKAKYSHQNIGHYGLVLEEYSHFTSPIRRYPDLVIHRIMSFALLSMKKENIEKRFRNFVSDAAMASTTAEIKAMTIERECEDVYKAEYMEQFIGQEFDGTVVGAAPHGLYVELANTVEGLVRVDDLPDGYFFDGRMKFTTYDGAKPISVGDKVKVKVLDTDISAGKVDFSLVM